MATLEKIRSKSVLLVVIIAVALLAFILGDAITNGRNLFGNNTTVAQIGSDKIDYQDYQRKQQELNQQMEEGRKQNPQAYANYDSQILPQQAIEQLVDEVLVNKAVEKTGIRTSPDMIRFFMLENPNTILPEMQTLIRNMQESGLNVQTPSQAYTVIFQPQTLGLTERQVEPFQRAWLAVEARYTTALGQMVYGNLLGNSFKANKLDVEATRRDYVAKANVKVAKKPYGDLDAKKYPVSDDEVKAAYEAKKEAFALMEPTKEVAFIAVDVPASAKDIEQCDILAATVVKELRSGSVSKETRKEGLDVQHHDMRLSDVKAGALKTFLETASVDSIAIIPGNAQGFNIAKLIGRTSQVDSLQISSIAVKGSEALISNVMAYANSGLPLDSINTRFSADSVAYQAAEWTPLYSEAGSMPKNLGLEESLYDSLYNSNGQYIVLDQQEGMAVLATVSQKSSPKEIVEYETVDYVLHPSDLTLSQVRDRLQKFVNENNTAAAFVKNAPAAGYTPIDLAITPSTPAIPSGYGYYPDSRSLVRWIVMDGKDGEVSKIYQDKDPANPTFYVAAVVESYKDYVPWSNKNVKDQLTAEVRREKAGKEMAKQYVKGSVEASAAAMQTEPVDIEALQSSKFDMTVTDPKVKGRILGSKSNKKVQSYNGDDAVYVFVVNSVEEEPVQMTDDQFAQMFLRSHQMNPSAVLRGNKKFENKIYKFEQPE